ncbi:MAG: metallopeptidase family protein [Alphaproteobacteria bacterium]
MNHQSAGPWSRQRAPSLGDLERLAITSFAALPAEFKALAGDIQMRVADFPDDDVLREMRAETPFDLLGLFQGIGLAHSATVPETGQMPNMIWLYRRPILDYWSEHDDTLGGLIRHVLVHEIGHHFGMSDEDMDAIEAYAAANEAVGGTGQVTDSG